MAFRYYEPNTQQMGGMLIYQGSRRQRGGNFADAIKRIALPIGRFFGKKAVKVGKDLTKRGIRAGVGALSDKLRGGPDTSLKQSFNRRAAAAADKAVEDYLGPDKPDIPFTSQDGMGLRRRKRRRKTIRRRRVTGGKRRSKAINKMKARRRGSRPLKRRKTINKRRRKTRKRRKYSDIFS